MDFLKKIFLKKKTTQPEVEISLSEEEVKLQVGKDERLLEGIILNLRELDEKGCFYFSYDNGCKIITQKQIVKADLCCFEVLTHTEDELVSENFDRQRVFVLYTSFGRYAFYSEVYAIKGLTMFIEYIVKNTDIKK